MPLFQNFESKVYPTDGVLRAGTRTAENMASSSTGFDRPKALMDRNAIDQSANSRDWMGSRTSSMIPRCCRSATMTS